jgi:hypothetical protein
MNSLKQDVLKYRQSTAFHEAAHYVSCVAQDIPVRELGLRIDSIGNGRSHIYCKTSGNVIASEEDKREIEKSVVLLFAGYLGQLKFFPELKDMRDVADTAIQKDMGQIDALLSDVYPNDPESWYKAKEILKVESDRLVTRNWSAIKSLASALWDQPWKPQVQLPPIETGWSSDKMEKSMNAWNVAVILREFGLNPIIKANA